MQRTAETPVTTLGGSAELRYSEQTCICFRWRRALRRVRSTPRTNVQDMQDTQNTQDTLILLPVKDADPVSAVMLHLTPP